MRANPLTTVLTGRSHGFWVEHLNINTAVRCFDFETCKNKCEKTNIKKLCLVQVFDSWVNKCQEVECSFALAFTSEKTKHTASFGWWHYSHWHVGSETMAKPSQSNRLKVLHGFAAKHQHQHPTSELKLLSQIIIGRYAQILVVHATMQFSAPPATGTCQAHHTTAEGRTKTKDAHHRRHHRGHVVIASLVAGQVKLAAFHIFAALELATTAIQLRLTENIKTY